ncbi:hypothetical protein [Nisaea sp.]|uniref:hypothetical protein n=1 Tax=Nisaea sp. TaxID=2024842 RepID=UPI003266E429
MPLIICYRSSRHELFLARLALDCPELARKTGTHNAEPGLDKKRIYSAGTSCFLPPKGSAPAAARKTVEHAY